MEERQVSHQLEFQGIRLKYKEIGSKLTKRKPFPKIAPSVHT